MENTDSKRSNTDILIDLGVELSKQNLLIEIKQDMIVTENTVLFLKYDKLHKQSIERYQELNKEYNNNNQ